MPVLCRGYTTILETSEKLCAAQCADAFSNTSHILCPSVLV